MIQNETNREMKKTLLAIMLLAAAASLPTSCRQAEEKNANGDYTFIDLGLQHFDVTDTLTMRLFMEAQQRVDEFVEFDGHRFVMRINNGACVGISEELFDYFKNTMEQTNARLKGRPYRQVDKKTVELLPMDSTLYKKRE